jgi:hypothetical protein
MSQPCSVKMFRGMGFIVKGIFGFGEMGRLEKGEAAIILA